MNIHVHTCMCIHEYVCVYLNLILRTDTTMFQFICVCIMSVFFNGECILSFLLYYMYIYNADCYVYTFKCNRQRWRWRRQG